MYAVRNVTSARRLSAHWQALWPADTTLRPLPCPLKQHPKVEAHSHDSTTTHTFDF